MAPMIAVGSAKAQGSKVKPINGSKPPRVRDDATQKMGNILAHLVLHGGDPASSSFIFESRPGGFLHIPLWAGI
jgi:hypothetical protein